MLHSQDVFLCATRSCELQHLYLNILKYSFKRMFQSNSENDWRKSLNVIILLQELWILLGIIVLTVQ